VISLKIIALIIFLHLCCSSLFAFRVVPIFDNVSASTNVFSICASNNGLIGKNGDAKYCIYNADDNTLLIDGLGFYFGSDNSANSFFDYSYSFGNLNSNLLPGNVELLGQIDSNKKDIFRVYNSLDYDKSSGTPLFGEVAPNWCLGRAFNSDIANIYYEQDTSKRWIENGFMPSFYSNQILSASFKSSSNSIQYFYTLYIFDDYFIITYSIENKSNDTLVDCVFSFSFDPEIALGKAIHSKYYSDDARIYSKDNNKIAIIIDDYDLIDTLESDYYTLVSPARVPNVKNNIPIEPTNISTALSYNSSANFTLISSANPIFGIKDLLHYLSKNSDSLEQTDVKLLMYQPKFNLPPMQPISFSYLVSFGKEKLTYEEIYDKEIKQNENRIIDFLTMNYYLDVETNKLEDIIYLHNNIIINNSSNIRIYDILGNEVTTEAIINNDGNKTIIDASNLNNGVYFCSYTSNNIIKTTKFINYK